MANPKVFFDANILLYTDDPRFPDKQKIAIELVNRHLLEGTGVVSLQVLQEYFSNATRKMKLTSVLAQERTRFFSHFTVLQPTLQDVFSAIDLHRLHQIAFWDAMIVRMALLSGARILYTEDLQDRRKIDSLEIMNPLLG
jgi:predicted nucleic acid-binding protein